LIRDEEFDGWREIPLKRDNLSVWSGPDICLPGLYIVYFAIKCSTQHD